MKRNQRQEIQQKSIEELKKSLDDTRVELSRMHIDHHMGKVHNTGGMKELRKNIARMMTVMGAKTASLSVVQPEEVVEKAEKVKKVSKKEEK